MLRVDVAAPATENRANDELIKLLADELGIGRSRLRIVRGATGRQKVVEVDLPAEQIDAWLAGLPARRSPPAPNR